MTRALLWGGVALAAVAVIVLALRARSSSAASSSAPTPNPLLQPGVLRRPLVPLFVGPLTFNPPRLPTDAQLPNVFGADLLLHPFGR